MTATLQILGSDTPAPLFLLLFTGKYQQRPTLGRRYPRFIVAHNTKNSEITAGAGQSAPSRPKPHRFRSNSVILATIADKYNLSINIIAIFFTYFGYSSRAA